MREKSMKQTNTLIQSMWKGIDITDPESPYLFHLKKLYCTMGKKLNIIKGARNIALLAKSDNQTEEIYDEFTNVMESIMKEQNENR